MSPEAFRCKKHDVYYWKFCPDCDDECDGAFEAAYNRGHDAGVEEGRMKERRAAATAARARAEEDRHPDGAVMACRFTLNQFAGFLEAGKHAESQSKHVK